MGQLKRSFLILIFGGLISAAATGGYAVIEVRSEYKGVCSKLSGFPGFLQQAGLLMAGTCTTVPGQKLCNAGAACTVGGLNGVCKNSAKPGGSAICSCLATPSP